LAYERAQFAKPRNVAGLPRALPPPEMEKLILENTAVSDDDLRELAHRRAQVAKDTLVSSGIAGERLFIVAARIGGDAPRDGGVATRVEFALR
jgi:hypothetical protein